MKIPIQNVYYLLCYAWDKLEEREIVAVEAIDSTSLAELFARVLISGTQHLVRRGFDRGYIAEREWTGRIRGKICFQEAVRQSALWTGKLPCDVDELSYNVLHNRILKATMRALIRTKHLPEKLSDALSQLCRLLSDVEPVELTSRVFSTVQLHRNNQFYDFLLKVCELVHRNLLVDEGMVTSKFSDFLQDERQMRRLFEDFVRNFYRVHTAFKVRREDIHWHWVAADVVSQRLLPKMQTDISLTSSTRKIIIDCKFTPNATQTNYEAEKLRSSHLYQIHAYMNNLAPGVLTNACEMMLLYPTIGTPLAATFWDKGRKISVRTINLNQEWPAIHQDLLALVA